MFVFCVYICCFDCKCKSLKRLGENTKTNRKKHNQHNNSKNNICKTKTQKYRISSPRTSANKSHKLFAEVRGLEILYLCCFCLLCFIYIYIYIYICVSSSCFVLFCVFLCCLCFRLVFLSCCIYNRKKTHINTENKHNTTRRKT